MAGGGKGGSTTSSVQVPAWLEDAARSNLSRADRVSQLGYTPYYGPDVAAFTPMQEASMQNTGAAANAFGMASPANPMAGMPQAQTFAGGVQGYSSAPMYQQSVDALRAAAPGQVSAMEAMFIDPVTGQMRGAPAGAGGQGMPSAPGMAAGGNGGDGGWEPGGQTAGGGYTGLRDMFNGGGPGASGNTFSGGPFSGVANMAGINPAGSRDGGGGMGGGK